MANSLYSRAFGLINANAPVLITEAGTGDPAVLLATPTGGVISTSGNTYLDAAGNLNVYIDQSKTWVANVGSGTVIDKFLLASSQFVSLADIGTLSSTATPGIKYVVDEAPYNTYSFDGTGLIEDLTKLELKNLRNQNLRKRILRPYWQTYRNYLLTLYPPVPNTGSVVYIDPTGAAGAGTFSSPLNAFPGSPVADTTYLFKERTKTGASASFTGFTQTGLVLGTYDAGSGERVFEPNRLATIDGGTYFRCALRWQGTSGNLTLSGLRIIGGYSASGGVQMFESITAPAASKIIVEHCVFEAMGSYELVVDQINNQAIAVAGPRLICRFNRICIPGDGISYSPGAGAGYEFIGNDITTPSNITVGGPDCIQIQRTSTNSVGIQKVIGNWLNQAANTKQAFLVSGGTPPASGEEMFFSRNMLFGTDLGVNLPLTPFVNGQIAYINNSLSQAVVVSNYFDQFTGWASVSANGILMNNIGIRDHSGEWLVGFGNTAGGNNTVVCNNLTWAMNTTWTGGATNVGLEFSGTGHTIKNNVLINMGMKLAFGLSETYNTFVGGSPVNTSNAVLALGANSISVSDAKLDSVGRPFIDSPLLETGSNVVIADVPLKFEDVFGNTSWNNDVTDRGPAQGWGE